mmetsp:Transcript_30755/g.73884  ORF Transcript_30755/g.73884 Transcript_30755/m.73884 type:complete len:333 (+) Transcript_30755:180-1178(+)
MPTLLILVRHALSTNNVLEEKLKEELGDKFKERYNQEKSCDPNIALPVGEVQAEALAAVFRDILAHVPKPFLNAPVELISSTMNRALHTMVPIARELGLPVKVLPEIHEAGGCWTSVLGGQPGATPAQIEHNFPGFHCDPGVNPNGWWSKTVREKADEADARAERVARRLLDKTRLTDADGHKIIVMVTHGDWMQRLLRVLITGNVSIGVDFKHLNTATTAIVLPNKEGARTQVVWINRGEHLDHINERSNPLHDMGQDECGNASPHPAKDQGIPEPVSPVALHRGQTWAEGLGGSGMFEVRLREVSLCESEKPPVDPDVGCAQEPAWDDNK